MENYEYENGLVSIVSPVYNGEEYLEWYLNSVLNQKYKKVELIIVNDGSTDKTKEILFIYKTLFERKGYTFIYLEQENKGASAAINTGLNYVRGEFLCWPDSDDILSPEYISSLKDALDNNPNCNIALASKMYSVYSFDFNFKHSFFERSFPDGDLFYDFVVGNNIVYGLGKFLVRTDAFFSANGSKKIYESRGGQNWQMMLPILYRSKYVFVDKYLYTVVERRNSHSRDYKSLADKDIATARYKDILEKVLDRILTDEDKEKYTEIIKQKYEKEYILNAFNYGEKKELCKRSGHAFFSTNHLIKKKELVVLNLQLRSRLFRKIYGVYRMGKEKNE